MCENYDKKKAKRLVREFLMLNYTTGQAQEFLNRVVFDPEDQGSANLFTYDLVREVSYQRSIIVQKVIRMIKTMYSFGLSKQVIRNVCFEIAQSDHMDVDAWLSSEQIYFLVDSLAPIKDEDQEKVKVTTAERYFVVQPLIDKVKDELDIDEEMAIAIVSQILGTSVEDIKDWIKG